MSRVSVAGLDVVSSAGVSLDTFRAERVAGRGAVVDAIGTAAALSNSFALGGLDASLAFRRLGGAA